MLFVIKNVNRVVLISATHVQLSTIPCSQKIESTTVGHNVPKNFQIEPYE